MTWGWFMALFDPHYSIFYEQHDLPILMFAGWAQMTSPSPGQARRGGVVQSRGFHVFNLYIYNYIYIYITFFDMVEGTSKKSAPRW